MNLNIRANLEKSSDAKLLGPITWQPIAKDTSRYIKTHRTIRASHVRKKTAAVRLARQLLFLGGAGKDYVMKKRIWSLQTKFILIITGITLLLTLFLGFLNLQTINNMSTTIARMSLNWQAQRAAEPLQNTLIDSSNILQTMAHALEDTVPDPNALSDANFQNDLKQHMENQFNMMANLSSTIYGFFILFNPAVAGQDGFWYTWNPEQKQYINHSQEDIKHFFFDANLGHFFLSKALAQKKPFWQEPYVSPMDGVRKIAYVVPVYSQGKLIAVMGFSIRMQILIDKIEFTKFYSNSYASLFSDDGKIYYHPEYPGGSPNTSLKDLGMSPYAKTLKDRDSNDHLLTYSYKGEPKKMAFKTLYNGMNLGVCAPESSLYAERTRAMLFMAFLIFVFGLIVAIIAALLANRIIIPLKAIDAAARRIGKGNYNQPVTIVRNDELGELAKNMNRTMLKMKTMVQQLEALALKDTLTNVWNNTAYEQQVSEINQRIAARDPRLAFSVLMLDINGMKGVNDQFGHAMGNEMLRRTIKCICSIYTHSSIFRVGGDEFLVLVMGSDYQNRFTLLDQLTPYNQKRDYQQERPWEQLAFAVGMSDYHPETDTTYQEIFLRADAAMYKNKKAVEGQEVR